MRAYYILLFPLLLAVLAAGCARDDRREGHAAVLQTLESQLYSPDGAVAEQAALALLSSKSEDAYRTLKSALASAESSTASAAVILAFTVQKDPRIRGEALDALGDVSPRTVELAKRYLVEVIGPSASSELISRARDDARPAAERVAAIEVVAQYGLKESVDGLLDILEDRNQEIVDAAAAALRSVTYQPFGSNAELWRSWYRQNKGLSRQEWQAVGEFYHAETERLKEEIARLEARSAALEEEVIALSKKIVDSAAASKRPQDIIDILTGAMPVEAQIYAASKLGPMKAPEAVPVLIEKAASDDPRLAEAATLALGSMEDPAALVVVAARLQDPDENVRLAAAKAYGQIPDSDLQILIRLIEDPSPRIRAAVAEAVGRRRWPDAFDSLLAALDDPSPDVRAKAAWALGELNDQRAVPGLLKLVDDDNATVAIEALLSLSRLPDPRSYDALIRAASHEESGVREAAIHALEKLLSNGELDRRRAIDLLFEISLSDGVARVSERAWKALLALIGDDPQVILDKVRRLMEVDQFDKGEALLKILADQSQVSEGVIEARRRLAREYLSRGRYEAALGYFRRVREADPNDAEARNGEKAAMEALNMHKDLAAWYAAELAAGDFPPESPERFLVHLEVLLESEDFTAVVSYTDQVLKAPRPIEESLRARLRETRERAFPRASELLVTSLGGEDEAERVAARQTLASHGRAAAAALVKGLESKTESVRSTCLELLADLAGGETFAFDPRVDPSLQKGALEKWHSWLDVPAPSAEN
ncbi:MAG: HEAT repeat domain-containing protein [Planctomycetota bacterium]|jgi:HEAT repeat protein